MAFTLKRMMMSVLLLKLGIAFGGDRGIDASRVSALPEQPDVSFKQYAGYITVDRFKRTRLFYWFIEAYQFPQQKPLLLWLNGGPGCSSVGYGAFGEIGPFFAKSSHPSLELNKNSWNHVANLLFLESPIGVGFSYSINTTKDIFGQNDNATAMDTYTFLNIWFRKFPHYKDCDFYIAGESYAGHYIPQVSQIIYDSNKNSTSEDQINLKGIALGNPLLDDETGWNGMVDYSWNYGLISDRNYDQIKQFCNFSTSSREVNFTKECKVSVDEMIAILNSFNSYSLYTPSCPHTRLCYQSYEPCRDDSITAYMNRADVQKAFHAINNTSLPYNWSLCNHLVSENWKFDPGYSSILPIINNLAQAGLRIWVYSGDTDARNSVMATRYALKKLGLKILKDWTAWYSGQDIAGWTMLFEGGLRFATLRGGSEHVPQTRPLQALQFIAYFFNNSSLPSNNSSSIA